MRDKIFTVFLLDALCAINSPALGESLFLERCVPDEGATVVYDAECGFLNVPRNHADPSGEQIGVYVL